ncbi:transcriptional regulator with XRE-family HTH domain [Amycolatopsis bartoniae]|uniref:Transcriptional regulator n=1 Tax=Amycolatopsis bartoniae TaxID=941986 RepID=A0A8H9IYB5_9PSEU|nr:helix-turn-helix transcriptional regulator [Amycolatopsis bartoniae]MBB2933466.1 transcriptional regulator with XRE-family HTH domain [Amycolatopsis bartoniae]TVT00400.1 helix-turn-helix transcriptional regulator [Amycolatopsis bartoniae]GHF59659.1 transcriptional regulator [Amycolatopsis bartoniae]
MVGRLDTARLYGALDAQREARGLSWRQLAAEAGVSPSLVSRMGNGHRPDLDGFIALVQWLGMPAETFMVWPEGARQQRAKPSLEAQLAPLLRAEEELSEADQQHVLDVVGITLRHMRARNQGG